MVSQKYASMLVLVMNCFSQEDFTWQEIWRTSIYLFKIRCNDRLVTYFSLMYSYRINTNSYIAFNIFMCRISIITYKMLIIAGTSNEKTSSLTIYRVLCRNDTIFYRQELGSLFQVQEKLKVCRNSKLIFSSSSFIADGNHVKTVWLHVVVFREHNIMHFLDIFIYLNIILWKYIKIALILSVTQFKPVCKFPNFRLH